LSQDSETKGLQGAFKKSVKPPTYKGANRRATGLIPEPNDEHGKPINVNEYINHRRFLVNVQATQKTCCVKFSSEKHKSRGALLIFRGRVLGALYGRKDLSSKLFAQQAYGQALKDLFDPETNVVAYSLSEPLAVATGALFHGEFGGDADDLEGANRTYIDCYGKLIDSKAHGCIMVNDKEDITLVATYVHGGKMVALYSGHQGWLPPAPQVAFQKVAQCTMTKVTTTVLKVKNTEEVLKLTFGLTGLADPKDQNASGPQKPTVPSASDKKPGPEKASLIQKKEKDQSTEQQRLLRQRLSDLKRN
jgi:hypothetical protein